MEPPVSEPRETGAEALRRHKPPSFRPTSRRARGPGPRGFGWRSRPKFVRFGRGTHGELVQMAVLPRITAPAASGVFRPRWRRSSGGRSSRGFCEAQVVRSAGGAQVVLDRDRNARQKSKAFARSLAAIQVAGTLQCALPVDRNERAKLRAFGRSQGFLREALAAFAFGKSAACFGKGQGWHGWIAPMGLTLTFLAEPQRDHFSR
jgi:hypothetical protein